MPAAPSIRNTTTSVSPNGNTSITLTRPAGVQNGDSIIVIISADDLSSITPPPGWQVDHAASTAGLISMWIYHKFASSEPASWTWTNTRSSPFTACCIAVMGANYPVPQDVYSSPTTAQGSPNATTTHTLSGLTTTVDNDLLLIAIAGARQTVPGTTWTPPTGTTELLDFNNGNTTGLRSMSVAYQVVNPAAAVGAFTWPSAQGTTGSIALAWALKPVPNTPPVISSAPVVAYGAGLLALGPNNTPGTITFTATDVQDTATNALTYEIRTGSAPGTGALVGSGTCTSGVSKVHNVAYNATGLVVGANTLYLHVSDTEALSVSSSAFTVRRDDVAPTWPVAPTVITSPVVIGSAITVRFTANDSTSFAANELYYEIRTAAAGGGSLITSGTFTAGLPFDATFTDSGLFPGSITHYLRARDVAANWSTDQAYVFTAGVSSSAIVTLSESAAVLSTIFRTRTYSVSFKALDALSTAAGEMHYQIRTAPAGGGTLLDSGTFTQNAVTTSSQFTDAALAEGNNTRYLRVWDGANNVTEISFVVVADIEPHTSSTFTIVGNDSAVIGLPVTDSAVVTMTESAVVGVLVADSAIVTAAQTPTIAATVSVSSNAVVTVVDLGFFFLAVDVTDTATVTGAGSAAVAEVKTATDTATVTASEVTCIAVLQPVSATVLMTDSAAVTVQLTASDTFTALITSTDMAAEPKAFTDTDTITATTGQSLTQIDYWLEEVELEITLYPNVDNIADALDGVYGPRLESYRMYKVDKQGHRLADITGKLTQGTIQATRTNTVSRTGTFTLHDASAIDLKVDHFMPVYVLHINGIELEFPQGVFYGTAPSASHLERTDNISVIANDLGIHLTALLSYPVFVRSGTNYGEAIKTVAAIVGLTNVNIPPTSLTVPNDFTWNPGSTWTTVINALAMGAGFLPVWFDAKGTMKTRERVALKDRAADVTYVADPSSILDGSHILLEPFDSATTTSLLLNEVVVQVNDPLRAPFWSTYYVENPDSPITLLKTVGVSGFSTSNFLEAQSQTSPAATILTPAKVLAATPAFPSNAFPLTGAMSMSVWAYLDPAKTANEVIAGCWASDILRSFLLRSASTAGTHGPAFLVSPDGVSEYVAQAPAVPVAGVYHVAGVFNPGGAVGPNILSNNDFESGLTAPGASWYLDGDISGVGGATTISWDTTTPALGARSLQVAWVPTGANKEITINQRVISGFRVGHPLLLEYSRKWTQVGVSSSVGVRVKAFDKNGSLIGTIMDSVKTSIDIAWTVSSILSTSVVPAGTAYLVLSIHMNGSSGSGVVCRWDAFSLKDALPGALSVSVTSKDGTYHQKTSAASQPATFFSSPTVFRAGYTGYGGDPYSSILSDLALYNGAITDTDVANLAAGMYAANVPFCIGYWRLDDLAHAPANDKSAHGWSLYENGTLNYQVLADRGYDRYAARSDVVNVPRIANQAVADNLARLLAEEHAAEYQTGTINTTLDPRRDINELYVLRIANAEGVVIANEKWVVDGWSFDMRIGGRMQHTVKKVAPA